MKKKIILILAGLGVLLSVFLLMGTFLPRLFPDLPSLRFERDIKKSATTTLDSIQKVGDLLVLRVRVEKVIDANSSLGWGDFLFGDRLLLIATGNASFGMDLKSLQANDIHLSYTEQGADIAIKLPPVQVLDVSLDETTTRVFSRSQGWLRFEEDAQLEADARIAAVKEIRRQVDASDDYRQLANANAHELMENLLRNLGFKTVTFE